MADIVNKDKKIEIQKKTIFSLREENEKLKMRIKDLEFELQSEKQTKGASYDVTKELLAQAENYYKEHQDCINSLNDAKEKYYNATQKVNEERKRYKKTFDDLFSTLKKNT